VSADNSWLRFDFFLNKWHILSCANNQTTHFWQQKTVTGKKKIARHIKVKSVGYSPLETHMQGKEDSKGLLVQTGPRAHSSVDQAGREVQMPKWLRKKTAKYEGREMVFKHRHAHLIQKAIWTPHAIPVVVEVTSEQNYKIYVFSVSSFCCSATNRQTLLQIVSKSLNITVDVYCVVTPNEPNEHRKSVRQSGVTCIQTPMSNSNSNNGAVVRTNKT